MFGMKIIGNDFLMISEIYVFQKKNILWEYFKRLSSEFYKNKKGQIVFVHETIVNGAAKTLEEIK